MKRKPYWYLTTTIYYHDGLHRTIRERRYGPKPKRAGNRHREMSYHEWCDR